jgi:hypothetical protein
MIVRRATIADLEKAMSNLNIRYKGNVIFRTLEQKGKAVSFTLKAVAPKRRGNKVHYTRGDKAPKQSTHACWHAHGHFFEELFKVVPAAVIAATALTFVKGQDNSITKDSGNWVDRNIGSMSEYAALSECCDCDLYDDNDVDDLQSYMDKVRAMDLPTVSKHYQNSLSRYQYIIAQCATLSLMPILINDSNENVIAIAKKRLAKGK